MKKRLISYLTTLSLLIFGCTAFALASNQVELLQRVGNGYMDEEFKQLAKWYLDNAEPGEKIVTTMPHVVSLFAPEHKKNFIHTRRIPGDSAEEFVRQCYEKKITYVAWDSRLGIAVKNAYYKIYRLKRITFLGPRQGPNNTMAPPPRKIGPFELVGTIQNEFYPMRFIFIYKLTPLPAGAIPAKKPEP